MGCDLVFLDIKLAPVTVGPEPKFGVGADEGGDLVLNGLGEFFCNLCGIVFFAVGWWNNGG